MKENKLFRRLVSIFLCILMLMTSFIVVDGLSLTAFAADNYVELTYDNLFSFNKWTSFAKTYQAYHYPGWSLDADSVIDKQHGTLTIIKSRTDKQSARIDAGGEGQTYYKIPVSPSTEYTFSFYAQCNDKSTPTTQALVYVYNYNDSSFVGLTGTARQQTSDLNTINFTTESNANYVEFMFEVSSIEGTTGVGSWTFANISLRKADAVTKEVVYYQAARRFNAINDYPAILSKPTRAGYVFNGWYIKGTSTKITTSESITSDKELVSSWIPEAKYNLTYDNLFSVNEWYKKDGRLVYTYNGSFNNTPNQMSINTSNGALKFIKSDTASSSVRTDAEPNDKHYQMTVKPDTEYTVSATVTHNSSETGTEAYLYCRGYKKGSTSTLFAEYASSDSTGEISFTVSTTSDTNYIELMFETVGVGKTSTWTFSDICVRENTSPYNEIDGYKTGEFVASGSSPRALIRPTRTGYTFGGWYVKGTNLEVTTNTKIKDNYYLESRWIPEKRTVSWITDGDALTGSYTNGKVDYGSSIVKPNTPTKIGYMFTGWSPAVPTTVTNDATYTANWTIKKQTVSWVTDGDPLTGTYTNGEVDYSTAIIEPDTPTKTGYTFTGWSPSVPETVTDDAVYTATWSLNKYSVTLDFDDDKGTTDTIEVAYQQPYGNLPVPAPRTGYVFDGWYTEAVGGEKIDNDTVMTTTNNHTLFAHWSLNKINVIFDGNSSTEGSMPKQTFIYSEAQQLVSNNFKKGVTITFDANHGICDKESDTAWCKVYRWNNSADGNGEFNYKDGQVVTNPCDSTGEDVTLYAQWTLARLSSYPIPQRANYRFAGWFTEPVGGTELLISSAFDKATTVYAHWEHDTFVFSNSSILFKPSEKMIYGFDSDTLNEESIKASFSNTNISVFAPTGKIGTGTLVQLKDENDTVYDTATVVVFGDINGDGKYDGTDSIIVSCLANGMLTKEQVGLAVYKAADANHDSEVNQIDVELLANAGLGLEVVNQKNFDSNEDDVDIEIGDLSISG